MNLTTDASQGVRPGVNVYRAPLGGMLGLWVTECALTVGPLIACNIADYAGIGTVSEDLDNFLPFAPAFPSLFAA